MIYLKLTISIISLITIVNCIEYAPIIGIDSGNVRGFVRHLNNGKSVDVYQGIRYGQANRFEKSEFVPKWNETYDAIEKRYACPQADIDFFPRFPNVSEDCLYLSVYRPKFNNNNNNESIPVMVWIHGGGFIIGSIFDTIYDPSYIVSIGNVIVVTVNYRLNAFGFLYGGQSSKAIGNQGLHDQILALQWVHNNIEKFGGNPNLVTLFGESAGSMSISALILSPLTRGLFHKAILQSGAANSYLGSSNLTTALEKTIDLAKRANCMDSDSQTYDEKVVLKCLKSKNISEILTLTKNDVFNGKLMIPLYGDDLMPMNPVKALKSRQFNQIDIMFGVVHNEGSSFVTQILPILNPDIKHPNITLQMTKTIISLMMMTFEKWEQKITDSVVEFYTKNLNETSDVDVFRSTIAEVFGDYHLVCPTIFFGEYVSKNNFLLKKNNEKNQTFYSYRLMLPLPKGPFNCHGWEGVCHGEDVMYLFYVPSHLALYSSAQIRLSYDMIRSWTRFAWSGHPKSMLMNDKNKLIKTIKWEPAIDNENDDSIQFMALDSNNYRMIRNYYDEKCNQFWKPIIFK